MERKTNVTLIGVSMWLLVKIHILILVTLLAMTSCEGLESVIAMVVVRCVSRVKRGMFATKPNLATKSLLITLKETVPLIPHRHSNVNLEQHFQQPLTRSKINSLD